VAPGGCVVLETINPECLFGLESFWLDLTHVRPYHADCVGFYLGRLGFTRIVRMYTSLVPEGMRVPDRPTANYIEYAVIAFR
jgi:hypothetical protein